MKSVLIIGATSGIGENIVRYYAQQGISLILAGRDKKQLQIISDDIKIRYGVQSSIIQFDALAFQTHEKFWEECLEQAPAIEGVVFCIGYLGDQKLAQQNFEEAANIIGSNYLSAVSILNIAANYLESQKRGFICAISSVAGDRGRQSNYMYGSAKGALSIYLQGLRNRLMSANVQVLTVKPGFVNTKMTAGLLGDSPLVAEPDKVAKEIVHGVLKKKNVVYTPRFWFWIMLIIKLIPEQIFKRLKM